LWVASTAIRKCWASEDKSDSVWSESNYLEVECGPKDKELIERVGNKNKHASTLEHLNYSFDIDGISRACLQELARHRHASLSVKSTRYTLKELKNEKEFHVYSGNPYGVSREEEGARVHKYCVVFSDYLDETAILGEVLNSIINRLNEGMSNDKVKYLLPEAYKTSLVWTVNARSLQNFLSLRTDKSALWEIRDLAKEIFAQLPSEHVYLFKDFVKEY
jgi:thymidylate synthase (FAD)